MPDAAQAVNRLPLDSSWSCLSTPVLTSSQIFRHLINGSRLLISLILTCHSLLPWLFLNAHHTGSLPAQLKAVWNLLLQAGSEGPTLIFCAVTHTFLIFKVRSWHTQTYHRFLRWMIFSPEWMLSQVSKVALERIFCDHYYILQYQLPVWYLKKIWNWLSIWSSPTSCVWSPMSYKADYRSQSALNSHLTWVRIMAM